jgi:[ribosomal protein S5]-alanine N-acetyltransferase
MVFRIRTERLILEDLTGEDFCNIQRIARDPDVMKYLLIWLENDEQTADFLQRGIDESLRDSRRVYVLAVRIPETGDFAGVTFIDTNPGEQTSAEVGCALLPEYQANGYASEILQELLKFGFGTMNLHRIYGKCDELNRTAARVLEKCGLKYEGTLREHVWLRDHWRSSRYYGILAGEFDPHGVKRDP